MDEIQHPSIIKIFIRMGREGKYLQAIYEKPTANIILNIQKLQAFPLRLC